MLYDKRWDRKPSVPGFVAWLERQDSAQAFDYGDCDRCAVGQYIGTMGKTFQSMVEEGQSEHDLLEELNGFAHVAWRSKANRRPTFGEVLTVARAAATK